VALPVGVAMLMTGQTINVRVRTPTQLFDPLLNAVFEKSQPQENNTGIRP
jgi:hypothetical protein